MSVNKVILVGNLGNDPEVRFAANGNAIANFSVATSENWRDKQTGERREKTEWHRVVIFGKLAEIAQQYLRKGSQVYLEGKLQTRKWQDQNTGMDRYSTEVVIDFNGVMQMLGSRRTGGDVAFDQSGGQDDFGQQAPVAQRAAPQQGGGFAQAPMGQQGQQGQQQQPAAAPQQAPQTPDYQPNDFDDDDVPF